MRNNALPQIASFFTPAAAGSETMIILSVSIFILRTTTNILIRRRKVVRGHQNYRRLSRLSVRRLLGNNVSLNAV